MSDTQRPLIIDCKQSGRGGRATVVVRIEGQAPVVDKITITDSKQREKLADQVCAALPGADREELLKKLAEYAANIVFPEDDEDGDEGGTIADRLVRLVQESDEVELFHTREREAYATITVGEHRETWMVNSKGFKEWLSRQCFLVWEKTPSSAAMQDALGTISGIAKFEGKEREVHLRIAGGINEVWLDLCDAEWRVVHVTPQGWGVVDSHHVPVRFVRRPAMMPLPIPISGGSIEQLRPLVNLPDDRQWTLCVGWLVGAFRPEGPYGVLAVSGEHGSAKSTVCKLFRRLLDPNRADLRRPPRDERDVFIAGGNSRVSGYNNISGLPPHISDAICALATDGGFATRQLYSNDEEAIFAARRPVMLNGIDPPASRPDLVDRCISLTLTPISEEGRREEAEIDEAFERLRPQLLGALLVAVSSALRNVSTVNLTARPRMADFARWVTAAEEGLGWKPGRFMAAYMSNRAQANTEIVEASPVGQLVVKLVCKEGFEGSATELLSKLNKIRGTPAPGHRDRDWPESSKALASNLRRLAPNLRALGMVVEFQEPAGRGKKRLIRLEQGGTGRSAPSAPSAALSTPPANDLFADHADRANRVIPAPTASVSPPDPAEGEGTEGVI